MSVTNPLIALMEVSDKEVMAQATYFQAQVTAIEEDTGRVYILRLDDEDEEADTEPYSIIEGLEPAVDQWVVMMNWGRTALCLGPIQREAQPTFFKLPGGPKIAWGAGTPESAVTAPVGSVYYRTDGADGTTIYTKSTGTGNTGWAAIDPTPTITITVEEEDSTVDAAVTKIDFDTGAFNVTSSPAGEANVEPNFGTGSGQIAEGNHTHGAASLVQQGFKHWTAIDGVSPSTGAVMATTETDAYYLGRAEAALTSFSIRHAVSVGGSSFTWAELAIATSPSFTIGGPNALTTRGSVSMTGVWNSTGNKTQAITTSGISAGDHIWLLAGVQASTVPQFNRISGDDFSGSLGMTKAVRPSTMSAGESFSTNINGAGVCLQFGWVAS